MTIALPENVKYIIGRLNERGFSAYCVGGCVRDAIMGRVPHDWDICTSAKPEDTREIFGDKKLVLAGVKHGTVGIVMSGRVYEVTAYRVESGYADRRRPESVRFVDDIEGDLSRRDFTVNAMAYNDENGLIDLFGGREDIENGIIRCVGEPRNRFSEDALRMLRAVRFAATFDFSIHEDTKKAILELNGFLDDISQERRTAELKGILRSKKPGRFISEYACVFERVLGISQSLIAQRARETDDAPPDFELRVGMLARDKDAIAGLKLSNAEAAAACAVAENIDKDPPENLPEARRMVFALGNFAKPVLKSMGASRDISKAEALIEEIEERKLCCSVAEMNISGRELSIMGFKGAAIGEALKILLFEIMDGAVENTHDALKQRAMCISEAVPIAAAYALAAKNADGGVANP